MNVGRQKTAARSRVEGFVSEIIQSLSNLLKMGEQEEEKVGTPLAKQQARLCQDFEKNPLEYKWPASSFCSCSLLCVTHKRHTGCTGKRDQIQFTVLSLNLMTISPLCNSSLFEFLCPTCYACMWSCPEPG